MKKISHCSFNNMIIYVQHNAFLNNGISPFSPRQYLLEPIQVFNTR